MQVMKIKAKCAEYHLTKGSSLRLLASSNDFFHIPLFILIMLLAIILPGIAIALLAMMIHISLLLLCIVFIWIAPFYLLGTAI